MTKPPDHYYPYFLMFLLHVKRVPRAVCSFLKTWLRDKVHIFWSEPISRRSISAGSRRAKSHLAGRSRSPDTRGERAEKGKAESREERARNLELNGAAWSTPAGSWPAKQSAHCLWQTPLSSALCRPPPHFPPYCPSPLWAAREKMMELLLL